MLGHLGFSSIGLIYMLMLEVPNIMWARYKSEGYEPSDENKVLLVFERAGQVLCTMTILFFSDYSPHSFEPWTVWLFVSSLLMILYEINWIRYFRSKQTVIDFYRSFLGIPVPGALLPVVAFLLLGIYGKVIWLIVSAIILGIGHIGIHLQHIKSLNGKK
ncbi:hypothetical protein E4665_15345 [Sporolactobacillus shoreae]|uniref:Uncharacterized protein n=1 Tax=Sporolactobacillus shoreae TaxID=1465501 RepID=A0A4Z0GJH2_9BACL|nr:hypothetical protein [Sporolactobacillus shoreae]TGA96447.1 hypothetical protein E4665_15345 [Sporolactobacillus shoreae]